MSTKLHTKSYSNNDRLFFLLNPNEDISENDPVRVVDAIVEGLDLLFSSCVTQIASYPLRDQPI